MSNVSWVQDRLRRAGMSQNAAVQAGYRSARWVYRLIGRTVWVLGLQWVDSIRRLTRTDDGWLIEGWAYHRGTDFGPEPRFRAWLVRRGRRIELDAHRTFDLDARAAARAAEYDYALNCVVVRLPDAVVDTLPVGRGWRLRVEIRGNGHRVRGWFRRASLVGSGVATGLLRRPSGRLAGPLLDPESGTVELAVLDPAVTASAVTVDGLDVTVDVSGAVTRARLVGAGQEPVALDVAARPAGATVRGTVPQWTVSERDIAGRRSLWRVEVESAGRWNGLHLDQDCDLSSRSESVVARPTLSQELAFVRTPVEVVVDAVTVVDGPVVSVHLAGRLRGRRDLQLAFRSRFETIAVAVTVGDDGTFTAEAELAISRWKGPRRPPPRGMYSLVAIVDGVVNSTFVTAEVAELFPTSYETDQYRLRISAAQRDQLALRFGPPRTEAEFGSWRQLQFRERYAQGGVEPLDAVYLESFFGRNATCNPLAIDAEFARSHPDIPRYWGVQDLSVVVPEGATALVAGTEEWWRVRCSARWVVTNEWLRNNFVKQPFQTVLQTWHGSMFKQIGLDRGGRGKAQLAAVERESSRWDLFISQAPETTPIIKGAYDLDEQVIEIGYPRNDELRAFDDERRRQVREHLGLPPDSVVVVYAPTWREESQQDVQLLDLEGLGPILGDRFTLLRRGHVRSLGNSVAARAANVLDVSTYPQINDLLGVADVLITDYSSMMFDFSVTGRPMIFYTPDIDVYTDDDVRGSYFDLEERAPGPVTRDVAEVVRLLRTIDTWPQQYQDRYSAWVERYNVYDDGNASRRAVEALLGFAADRS